MLSEVYIYVHKFTANYILIKFTYVIYVKYNNIKCMLLLKLYIFKFFINQWSQTIIFTIFQVKFIFYTCTNSGISKIPDLNHFPRIMYTINIIRLIMTKLNIFFIIIIELF